jgi:RimJ/RimL family protein N-acetyltransferase
MTMKLRLATLEDADFLLLCRNDSMTRKASSSTHKVTKEEHMKWLNNILQDPKRTLYIAVHNTVPVGSARADLLEDTTELSWTVAPNSRGQGIGEMMMKILASKVSGSICARIKQDNHASINIAKALGMELYKEENGMLYFIRR